MQCGTGCRGPDDEVAVGHDELQAQVSFDRLDNPFFQPGKPVQVNQTNLLKDLHAIHDGPRGHCSVRPVDDGLLSPETPRIAPQLCDQTTAPDHSRGGVVPWYPRRVGGHP